MTAIYYVKNHINLNIFSLKYRNYQSPKNLIGLKFAFLNNNSDEQNGIVCIINRFLFFSFISKL